MHALTPHFIHQPTITSGLFFPPVGNFIQKWSYWTSGSS